MATKVPIATKVSMGTKVPIAQNVILAVLTSYVIWACFILSLLRQTAGYNDARTVYRNM